MTSDAKGNDTFIREMLKSKNWYNRGKESFFIFKQPLVPLLSISDGQWLVQNLTKVINLIFIK